MSGSYLEPDPKAADHPSSPGTGLISLMHKSSRVGCRGNLNKYQRAVFIFYPPIYSRHPCVELIGNHLGVASDPRGYSFDHNGPSGPSSVSGITRSSPDLVSSFSRKKSRLAAWTNPAASETSAAAKAANEAAKAAAWVCGVKPERHRQQRERRGPLCGQLRRSIGSVGRVSRAVGGVGRSSQVLLRNIRFVGGETLSLQNGAANRVNKTLPMAHGSGIDWFHPSCASRRVGNDRPGWELGEFFFAWQCHFVPLFREYRNATAPEDRKVSQCIACL